VPYKDYDAVVIFGVAEMMAELSASLQQQLRYLFIYLFFGLGLISSTKRLETGSKPGAP